MFSIILQLENSFCLFSTVLDADTGNIHGHSLSNLFSLSVPKMLMSPLEKAIPGRQMKSSCIRKQNAIVCEERNISRQWKSRLSASLVFFNLFFMWLPACLVSMVKFY